MSMPTVAIAKPSSADSAPSSRFRPTITMIASSPMITTRNSSGGPNVAAAAAVTGAARLIRIAPTVPATNEPTAAMTSAGPARPALASG
nr:hypothetical protein [Pseudonocardia sp. HH130630-07]